MSSMPRFLKVAGAVLLFLFAVGIGAALTNSPVAETADPTPDPVAVATPEPTDRPTAEPTAEPTPDPALDELNAYLEFGENVLSFAGVITADLDTISGYADIGSTAPLARAADHMAHDISGELRWLNSHKPMACYGSQYRTWRNALIAYQASAQQISTGARFMDVVSLNRGVAAMQRGTRLMDLSTASIDDVTCGGL